MLDFDRIELEPAPNRFFDADAAPDDEPPRPGSLESALDFAYAERLERYERELDAGYRVLRFSGPPPDRYPRHTVALPGRTIDFVYDNALDRRLLEVYVAHGWSGIRAIQAALARAARSPVKALRPWDVVKSFFRFARNRLYLLVRRALIDLERKAADEIVLQLSLTAGLVNEAWTSLNVQMRSVARPEQQLAPIGRAPALPAPVLDTTYTLGNRPLAKELRQAVARAVQARDDLAYHRDRSDRLARHIEQARHDEGRNISGGPGAEIDLAETERWLAEHRDDLDLFYGDVHALCPVAVLAVPLMALPFTQEQLEQTLGEVLIKFRGEAERIGRAFAAGAGWLEAALPAPRGGKKLEELDVGTDGPEELAVAAAIAKAGDRDPEALSLLSGRTLAGVVAAGRVEKDSFAYVVLQHLERELIVKVEAQRENAALVESVAAFLDKGAAVLSLALWAVPAGRIARGVSAALGIGLIAYQAYSVVHQLARYDAAINTRLIDMDRRSALEVAYVTELARMRDEYLGQLTTALVTEVALIVAAKAWPDFKQLVHLRGYYMDLETLVGE